MAEIKMVLDKEFKILREHLMIQVVQLKHCIHIYNKNQECKYYQQKITCQQQKLKHL
ncbi:unnamed protein product [Paramecium octaurelia]|uniref:Uncharacterized protein n=1 Tax=Paramecium octaurelia TaxID=43137 RepID=A0A8S1X5S8_PAROT|nr:unnamed protein product [Paramecium octaurelia]